MKFDEFKEKMRTERSNALIQLFEKDDVIDINLIYNLVMQIRILSKYLKEFEAEE